MMMQRFGALSLTGTGSLRTLARRERHSPLRQHPLEGLRWAEEPFGWFAFLHGEVLASRKTG